MKMFLLPMVASCLLGSTSTGAWPVATSRPPQVATPHIGFAPSPGIPSEAVELALYAVLLAGAMVAGTQAARRNGPRIVFS